MPAGVPRQRVTQAAGRPALPVGASPLADPAFRTFLLVLFLNGLIAGPLSSFLPIYVSEALGAGQSLTANLRTVSLAFMAISALAGGQASDSFGTKLTFFLGILGTPAAAAIYLVDSIPALYLLSAYSGVGLGLLSTGSQSYLINSTWLGRIGAATGIYFAGRTLGGAFGDPIGGAILQISSFRVFGLTALLAIVPVLAILAIFLPGVSPAARGSRGTLAALAGFFQILVRGKVLALAVVQLLRTTFWGAASLALPFLIKSLTGSNLAVGWFGGASMAAGVVAVLVMGPVSDRIGRRKAVLAGVGAMIAGSVLLAAMVDAAAGLMVAGALASIGAWTLSGQVPPLVKEIERGGEAGRVMAMASFSWALGTLVGAQLHGFVTESSPRALFLITTAILIAAMGAAAYLLSGRVMGSGPARLHAGTQGAGPRGGVD